jgi:hypothetical protein
VFSATSLRFFSYLRMLDSSLVEKFASHSTHPETSLATKQFASGQDLPDPFLTLRQGCLEILLPQQVNQAHQLSNHGKTANLLLGGPELPGSALG